MENSYSDNRAGLITASRRSGRIPPQDLNAERAVLGSCLFGRKYFDRAETVITSPEMFYKEAHKLLWTAMLNMGGPIDFGLLKAQLEKEGTLEECGGVYGLTELYEGTFNSENVEYHAAVVREMSLRRKNIIIAQRLEANAYDYTVDIFEAMEQAEAGIQESSGSTGGIMNAMAVYTEIVTPNIETAAIRRLEAEKAGRSTVITGVPGGLDCIDRETGGYADTDLIIVAARPAMGKTHFMLKAATTAAMADIPVCVFSLEMSKDQLVQRIVSYDSGVNTRDMRQGNVTARDWQSMNSAAVPLEKIWIDDTSNVGWRYIKSVARSARKNLLEGWKKRNPKRKAAEFKMIILIDYLQLMAPDEKKNGTREQEVSAMARGLKDLAKKINCPVIALSQLSRAVETRGGDKRPILSDLKESGDIEAAADMVIFLYRAEYYGLMTFEDGRSTKDVGELIVAKYRHGRTGEYEAEFTGRGGWRNPGEGSQRNQQELFPDPKRVQPKVIDYSNPVHSEENQDFFDKTPRDDVF